MKLQLLDTCLELFLGDITQLPLDAIANAANSGLRGGGGVDGAIHRAGGPAIMAQCRQIGGCPTGEAVVTTGGKLPARYVIHAVGPVWRGGRAGEPELLRSAYRQCLLRADELRLTSLAFPSISTGIYGFPVEQACPIAVGAVLEHVRCGTGLERIVFCLYSERDNALYRRHFQHLLRSEPDLVEVHQAVDMEGSS